MRNKGLAAHNRKKKGQLYNNSEASQSQVNT